MTWQRIKEDELMDWQKKISEQDASLFQFPTWLQAFKEIKFFTPRFLKLVISENNWAYCGFLEVNIPFLKVALVSFGPVMHPGFIGSANTALQSLIACLKAEGFILVRFSGAITEKLEQLACRGLVKKNLFPFYNDIMKNYVVSKKETAEELKTSFSSTAKNRINRAAKNEEFEFVIDNAGQYLDIAYELFSKVSKRKGFKIRPKAAYKTLFSNNKLMPFASLYLCFLKKELVNAALVIRDRSTSLYMSGGLDTHKIDIKNSPSIYLHYYAMQNEFYTLGTTEYNMVYSEGDVGHFKNYFHPEYKDAGDTASIILDQVKFNLYSFLLLNNMRMLKKFAKKIVSIINRG